MLLLESESRPHTVIRLLHGKNIVRTLLEEGKYHVELYRNGNYINVRFRLKQTAASFN